MDILYLLSESDRNGFDIKYSLRSIEKFCKGYDRLFICGGKPDFLKPGSFIHVPCKDPYDKKHKNMLLKIHTTIRKTDISKEFIVSSDDHFYVRPFNFENLGYYKKGMLPSYVEPGCPCEGYRRSMVATREFLKKNRLPLINFSQHCGHRFNREIFTKFPSLIRDAFQTPRGVEPTCLMHNLMMSQGKIKKVEPRKDLKIKEFKNEADLRRQLAGYFCFSIYDSVIDKGLRDIFRKWFPNKSKWEK